MEKISWTEHISAGRIWKRKSRYSYCKIRKR